MHVVYRTTYGQNRFIKVNEHNWKVYLEWQNEEKYRNKEQSPMMEDIIEANHVELIQFLEWFDSNNNNPGFLNCDWTQIFKLNENYLVAFKCRKNECLSRAIKYYIATTPIND